MIEGRGVASSDTPTIMKIQEQTSFEQERTHHTQPEGHYGGLPAHVERLGIQLCGFTANI